MHACAGIPSDVMIGSFRRNTAGVDINWIHNNGNYDPSHYTVQLFENNAETKSIAISAESNRLVAVFAVSFDVNVYARITVTSKCSQTSDGVFTDTITSTSKS